MSERTRQTQNVSKADYKNKREKKNIEIKRGRERGEEMRLAEKGREVIRGVQGNFIDYFDIFANNMKYC